MTSRRLYERAADVLSDGWLAAAEADQEATDAVADAMVRVTRGLADAFAADNPRFDRARFYAAAGLTKERQS